MKTLPMMTSSSSLNTVLNTTVTLSFLASKYLRRQNMSNMSEILWKHDPQFVSYIKYAETCKTCFNNLHGLVVSVVDHGSLLALLALLLELEVLFKHRGEAVPLEHPGLMDNLIFVGW